MLEVKDSITRLWIITFAHMSHVGMQRKYQPDQVASLKIIIIERAQAEQSSRETQIVHMRISS